MNFLLSRQKPGFHYFMYGIAWPNIKDNPTWLRSCHGFYQHHFHVSSQVKSSAIYFKTQTINKIQLKQINRHCNVTKYQISNVNFQLKTLLFSRARVGSTSE